MLKTAFRFTMLTLAISGLGTGLIMGAANAATPTKATTTVQHKATGTQHATKATAAKPAKKATAPKN